MTIQSSAVAVAALVAVAAAIAGCTPATAGSRVATQNLANASALAANTDAIARSLREHARTLCDLRLHAAQERVALALARIRIALPDDWDDIDDPAAPWRADVEARILALRTELASAPIDPRDAILDALAQREPALIDAAAGDPAFSPARIARDAIALDDLHTRLEHEHDPTLRAALLARRAALLAPYRPVRTEADLAAAYLDALDRFLATLAEQSRTLLLHAHALADFTGSAATTSATAESLYRSPDLRDAVLDLTESTRGRATRDRLAAWLAKGDAVLDVLAQSPDQP